MKIKLLILSFFIPFLVSAQEVEKKIGACTFNYDELLTFRVHYGFITGGEATISTEKTWLNGQEVFHAKLAGKTSGLIDKIYKVHDIYESFFHRETNLPAKAVRNIREGNYRFYDEVAYHHDELYVESQRKGKVTVPKNTLDMVSVLFYLRRIDLNQLKINDYIRFDTYFSDAMFPFYVVYKGKETISISSGKYKCFKFVPIVEPGRIFANNDDMTIWFSDDMNKIPISIKFDILVGSFRCDLEKFENLKFPFTAKVK
ncbi:MAG: DUF3108 domain-containing protein [Bacteroidales bacterium]|jgi:hypothetical protein|nr:DUF3108 domain-containing protein [Bacteroidales bacterium]